MRMMTTTLMMTMTLMTTMMLETSEILISHLTSGRKNEDDDNHNQ